MKKEYRKVVTLDEADIERAIKARTALLKLMPQLGIEDQDMDVLRGCASFLEELMTAYYN